MSTSTSTCSTAPIAPGCPGARPGGLSVRDLAEGVRRCARNPKVVSIDLVEVDPEADRDGLTLDAMAHLMLSAVAGYAERESLHGYAGSSGPTRTVSRR